MISFSSFEDEGHIGLSQAAMKPDPLHCVHRTRPSLQTGHEDPPSMEHTSRSPSVRTPVEWQARHAAHPSPPQHEQRCGGLWPFCWSCQASSRLRLLPSAQHRTTVPLRAVLRGAIDTRRTMKEVDEMGVVVPMNVGVIVVEPVSADGFLSGE